MEKTMIVCDQRDAIHTAAPLLVGQEDRRTALEPGPFGMAEDPPSLPGKRPARSPANPTDMDPRTLQIRSHGVEAERLLG